MKIDLSKNEITLLDEALQAWERDPQRDAAMGSVMTRIFSLAVPKEHRSEITSGDGQVRLEAEVEVSKRRRQATMLRAKLFQAEALDSEHFTENLSPGVVDVPKNIPT